jgi:hypothetical protein
MLGMSEQGSGGSVLDMVAQQGAYWTARNSLATARSSMYGFTGGKQTFARMMIQETMGQKPDLILARKVTGMTFAGRTYRNAAYGKKYAEALAVGTDPADMQKLIGKTARYAPSLAHLSPSRHLTMLSMYGGQSPAGMLVEEGGTSVAKLMNMSGGGAGNFSSQIGDELMGFFGAGNRGKKIGKIQNYGGDTLSDFVGSVFPKNASAGFESQLSLNSQRLRSHMSAGNVKGIQEAIETHANLLGANEAGADIANKKLGQWMAKYGTGRAALKGLPTAINLGTKAFMAADFLMWGVLAAQGIWWGGKQAVRAVTGSADAISTDFRRGWFQSSSTVSPFVGSTQRQRALMVMNQTGINMQSLLGNEASYIG